MFWYEKLAWAVFIMLVPLALTAATAPGIVDRLLARLGLA